MVTATKLSPTKLQAVDVIDEETLSLTALLIRAMSAALLLPLMNPVTIAIATIPQEERRRKEIKFFMRENKVLLLSVRSELYDLP